MDIFGNHQSRLLSSQKWCTPSPLFARRLPPKSLTHASPTQLPIEVSEARSKPRHAPLPMCGAVGSKGLVSALRNENKLFDLPKNLLDVWRCKPQEWRDSCILAGSTTSWSKRRVYEPLVNLEHVVPVEYLGSPRTITSNSDGVFPVRLQKPCW